MINALIVSFMLSFFSCDNSSEEMNIDNFTDQSQDTEIPTDTVSFLALGDSYTIGESVEENLRWPVQLVTRLRNNEVVVNDPKIIATTGWTTKNLLDGIEREGIEGNSYTLVSLLIGVNNQFQGKNIDIYKEELPVLLDKAIAFAGGKVENVIVLSIPDYGVSPFGQNRDPEKIAREIDLYNSIKKAECEKRGIKYFDITEISRRALDFRDLLASDNLHPSGKMYALWVDLIYEDVKNLLDSN